MPRPYSLVIETSTPHASIALVGENGVLDQRVFSSDRNHNAKLFEPLEALLSGGAREQIRLVLVGSGPGSYSGTRVGIAAAQGVAIALGCPAVAVPSILAVPSVKPGASCIAIGDARRGSFWIAEMKNLQLTEEPSLCDAAGLELVVSNSVANGIQIVSFEDAGRFPVTAELSSRIATEFPDAARLWQAWQAATEETRQAWHAAIPQPIYLKPPHITPAKRSWLVRPD